MVQKLHQFNISLTRSVFFFTAVFLFLFASPSWGQGSAPTTDLSAVTVFVDEERPVPVVDFKSDLLFIFEIPDPYRIYKSSVRLELDQTNVFTDLVLPDGEFITDEVSGEDVETYQGQVTLSARITFPRDFDFSKKLTGNIFYQGCHQKICQREQESLFTVVLNPDAATLRGVQKPGAFSWKKIFNPLTQLDVSTLLGRSVGLALLVFFLAGVLTSLTPCVLPIIPLTLAFLGVTPIEKKLTRVHHVSFFTLGMVVMYATLGVVSALLGRGLGFIYQSQLFLVFLVLFFVAMALWMFGVFHAPVFSKIQSAVVRYQPQGRFRYFYAGLTVGVLAVPCVGPVVGPLLVYISTTHDVLAGFVLMLLYALGLSVLFFILGFFSNHWITQLGQHTRWVKNILGTLLILVAAYYLQILAKPLFVSHIPYDPYFDYDYQHAQSVAQEQSKRILMDFYADWCVACHELEKEIWSQPDVRTVVVQSFIPVKIDCTTDNPQCDTLDEQFNISGLPTLLFLDTAGSEIKNSRIVGSGMTAADFKDYVQRMAQ